MGNYYSGDRNERGTAWLREEFLDKAASLRMLDETFRDFFLGSSHGTRLAKDYGLEFAHGRADWLHDIARKNVEVIFKYGESPIELLFFNAVNALALGCDNPIHFTEPMTFSEEVTSWLVDRTSRANDLIKWYQEHHDAKAGWGARFGEWVKATGDYSADFSEFLYHRVCDQLFGMRYLSMQAEFPEVVPGPFPVRVDGFVYRFDLSVKTVIECDGFVYHKEEHAFIRDRQKDRFFRKKGFDVIRFAGSEIHHDPLECANQLVDQIFGHAS